MSQRNHGMNSGVNPRLPPMGASGPPVAVVREALWPLLCALGHDRARSLDLHIARAGEIADAWARAGHGPFSIQRTGDTVAVQGFPLVERIGITVPEGRALAFAMDQRGIGTLTLPTSPGRRAVALGLRLWSEANAPGALPGLRAALLEAGWAGLSVDPPHRTQAPPIPRDDLWPLAPATHGGLLALAEVLHDDPTTLGNPAAFARTAEPVLHAALDLVVLDSDAALIAATCNAPELYPIVHTANVVVIAMVLARALGLSALGTLDVARGALWSEFGMVGWSGELRAQADPLSREQVDLVLAHPVAGWLAAFGPDVCEPGGRARAAIAWEHHTGLDAEGYPRPAPGGIPILHARIVAVADAYDALVHDRGDRPALARPLALEALAAEGGARFDRGVLAAFFNRLGRFPPGSVVKLKDGSIAIVAEASRDPRLFDRPTVLVVRDRGGEPLDDVQRWDLGQQLGERATRIAAAMQEGHYPERLTALVFPPS